MTQFEETLEKIKNKTFIPPIITYESKNENKIVDPIYYQLVSHKFVLNLMSRGIKCKTKLKDIKDYYGLKSRTAKGCLEELRIITQNYKKEYLNT